MVKANDTDALLLPWPTPKSPSHTYIIFIYPSHAHACVSGSGRVEAEHANRLYEGHRLPSASHTRSVAVPPLEILPLVGTILRYRRLLISRILAALDVALGDGAVEVAAAAEQSTGSHVESVIEDNHGAMMGTPT